MRQRSTGEKRLRAAIRRLARRAGTPQAAPAKPPAWGSDEWHLAVETRLANLEAKGRADRLTMILALALVGVLDRLLATGALDRLLDLLR